MIDPGSFEAVDPLIAGRAAQRGRDAARPFLQQREASNVLLVGRRESQSGRPIAVMGPQVGYYSPQILMEMEIHGPDGLHARGATFPGISLYVLLGRGQDFAWSATTANTDVVDQFVEKLCEPDGSEPTTDSEHYLYKGECVPFKVSERQFQTIEGRHRPDPAAGPLAAAARPPARSPERPRPDPGARHRRWRAGRDRRGALDVLPRARVRRSPSSASTSTRSTAARSFRRTMREINFAFNWFYADDRDIAWTLSGWYPKRAKGTHPDFPAWGTGEWDWQGFDTSDYSSKRDSGHAAAALASTRAQGYLVNWNNKQAPGWRSADDYWNYGSVQRMTRLEDRIRARDQGRAEARPGRADPGNGAGRDDRPARVGALSLAAPRDRPREGRSPTREAIAAARRMGARGLAPARRGRRQRASSTGRRSP